MTYSVSSLFFMRIQGDDYYYLGEYSDESNRVYIPTLNKSYSRSQVIFGEQLTSEYVFGVKGPDKKIKCDSDDFGNAFCISRKELTKADIKKIEKDKNAGRTPSRKDKRFFR